MRSREEFFLQKALVRMIESDYPLFRVSAVPNGGSRNLREASNLKLMGVRAGEPDLILRLPEGAYWNLELKTDRGRLSPAQKKFREDCERLGHKYFIIKSVEQAAAMLGEEYGSWYRSV